MTAQPWEPGADDPDRADDTWELLASLPVHLRTAGAALLALPADYEIPYPGHSAARVPAGRAFVLLASGQLDGDQVVQYLRAHGLARPGLVEAGHSTRKEHAMPTTTATRFFAVVGQNIHSPGRRCDIEGCRAVAEFAVSCADETGALVADTVVFVCAEHLAAQCREACEF